MLLGFIGLAYLQARRERAYQSQLVANEAKNAAQVIAATLKQTSLALARYATRLEYLGTSDKDYLEGDSRNYLEQLPILKRIGLTSPEYRVVWSYPPDKANQVQGYDESQDPVRDLAFKEARQTHKPSLSQATTLRSGGTGFLLPVALYPKGVFSGMVYATVNAELLFKDVVSAADFQLVVREQGRNLFASPQPQSLMHDLAATYPLTWGQAQLELEVVPTAAFIARGGSAAPLLIVVSGSLISLILGALLLIVLRSRRAAMVNAEDINQLNLRLGIALDAAKMASWSFNKQTREIWRSENHDALYGHHKKLDHWDREAMLEHVLLEDREQIERMEPASPEDATSVDFRIRRHDDQSVRWLSTLTQVIVGQDKVPLVVGIVRDITDEKRANLEVKAALELRKAILDASSYAIISTDAAGIIQTFNAAAKDMLGYDASEIVGKKNPGIFHLPEEVVARAQALTLELGRVVKPGFDCFTARVRSTRVADEQAWTFVRKDGSRLPVSLTLTLLYDESGEIAGFLGMAIDLTESKRMQEELMVTNERLMRVIEATGEGIWEREFGGENRILFLDDQAKKILGVEHLKEPSYADVIANMWPEDLSKVGATINHHVTSKSPMFEVEMRLKTTAESSQQRWICARGKVVNDLGTVPRLMSTVRDVSQIVEDRNQLHRALREAEEGTRVKADFLANMSHEIRTPLNGIIGMADLLVEMPLDAEQKKYARIVQQSGVSLLTLVNDILDFSKIDAGKMKIESAPFSVQQTVGWQSEVLAATAKGKGLALVTSIAPQIPETLLGDAGRLGQILLNLIGNAIKFTAKGSVTVRVEPCSAAVQKPGQLRLRWDVTDTGIGISMTERDRLFNPFVQADESTARKFGGTGLGLSICKRLVEMMGGEIGVDSVPGRGSTFWFELPLAVPPAAVAADSPNVVPLDPMKVEERDGQAAEGVIAKRSDRRILVAEDNATNQVLITKLLDRLGYQADLADNGHEVLKALTKTRYDLIIMDCQMPEMDGFGATRLIRGSADENVRMIPIIALTASAMAGDDEQCLAAGMDDYMTKPLKKEALGAKIALWLGRRHRSASAA